MIKTERNWKRKIPHIVLERRTLCFSSYKNRKLKIELWWVGACERKKRAFFVPLILSERISLTLVLSQCIVYCIYFQLIHTLHIKNITSYTFLLAFKIVESLPCISFLEWKIPLNGSMVKFLFFCHIVIYWEKVTS